MASEDYADGAPQKCYHEYSGKGDSGPFYCRLDDGHNGPHVAKGPFGVVLARWEDG